jgi:hypothetical protein
MVQRGTICYYCVVSKLNELIKINMSFHVVILQRDTKGWYSRKCSIVKRTLLLCICYACSSALDTRRRVGFRMLHFLKHRPLVSPAEVQPNSMLSLTLSLWYKEDCKNTIYPFTPFFSYAALLFLKLFSAAQQNIFYKRKYYFM